MPKEHCPKCGATPIHLHCELMPSWEPIVNECFLCGFRSELMMHSAAHAKRLKDAMAKNSKSFKDCAGGCGARIAINNKSDLCRKCRKVKY